MMNLVQGEIFLHQELILCLKSDFGADNAQNGQLLVYALIQNRSYTQALGLPSKVSPPLHGLMLIHYAYRVGKERIVQWCLTASNFLLTAVCASTSAIPS